MEVFLGIDTSNYRTSVALADGEGRVLCNARALLPVEHGALGLRQSDAVFCHIRQLPALVEQAFEAARGHRVCGVGVSTQPRRVEGSYMPVFLAGKTVAQSIACALDVPLHTFSHQQGHLRAAEINCPMPDEYLGVHLSGGTTEILRVQTEKYSAEILGGTEDIAAGQWVDRAGVAMELHFPAGPEMEALAQQTQTAHLFTVAVKGTKLYFSGAETQTKRAITEGVPRCEIARGVFLSLGRALAKAVLAAYEQTGLLDVLIAGGVSANELVKQQLRLVCAKKAPALRLHFADPQYAGDNAAGIALLAKEAGC